MSLRALQKEVSPCPWIHSRTQCAYFPFRDLFIHLYLFTYLYIYLFFKLILLMYSLLFIPLYISLCHLVS